ncbi:MAG TPA: hypothetical protein VMW42_03140, partial [Desulfatiglandales bacterium]|nr:hypothetical protein [Desulfatiglandales bacterium]
EDNRKTYMALPLQLGIRKPVPAIKLTAFGAAFSAGITIFYYFWFIRLTIPIGLAYGYILCLAAIISIVIYLLLCCYFEKKEDEAEDKLTLRDPNPHTKGCVVKKEDNQ